MKPISVRKVLAAAVAAIAAIAVSGCGQAPTTRAPPAPREISADSVGHFCGMLLAEHPGPKGQIFLSGQSDPVWFASVKEAFAYTMLEEEPKNIAAIYVTDMGKTSNWDAPGPGIWIDATKAYYVIGGRRRSGMGENEAVPFGNPEAARQFAARDGGHVVTFAAMPKGYILEHSGEPASGRAGGTLPGVSNP